MLAALRAGPDPLQRVTAGGLLRRGSRGPEVEALQAALGGAGYAVAVDGIFGPATQAAVVGFQRAAGLAADGIVGPATRGALAGGTAKAKGAVEKEAWAPDDAEQAAKEAAAKEAEAKKAPEGADKEDWWLT